MLNKKNNLCAFLIIITLWLPQASANNLDTPLKIEVGTYPNHLQFLLNVTQNLPCNQIEEFKFTHNLITNEAILLCLAFNAANFDIHILWKAYPLQPRLKREIELGNIVMGSYTFWGNDASKLVYKSENMLEPGEFVKGIYTRAKNTRLLSVKNSKELRNYRAVSNHAWKYDQTALNCAGIDRYDASTYTTMFKMVNAGRADFLLTAFSTRPDRSQIFSDIKLIPLDGFKFTFNDSLNFFVSKAHPDGKQVFQALSKGLAILKDNGTLKTAYQAAGFNLEYFKNWKDLSC